MFLFILFSTEAVDEVNVSTFIGLQQKTIEVQDWVSTYPSSIWLTIFSTPRESTR